MLDAGTTSKRSSGGLIRVISGDGSISTGSVAISSRE